MVSNFNVVCTSGGRNVNVRLSIGEPKADQHPIYFQNKWLSSEKGVQVPNTVLEALEKIQKLALENNIPFEDLCSYALFKVNEDLLNTKLENNEAYNQILGFNG